MAEINPNGDWIAMSWHKMPDTRCLAPDAWHVNVVSREPRQLVRKGSSRL